MLDAWTPAVMWLLPATLVGLALLGGALWTLRRQRHCPSCRTPMRPLERQPLGGPSDEGAAVPSYEVLVCDGCSNAATLVHGQQSRFAYCPSCLNRSMRTPCIRQPDGSVKVEERCELCGFRAERVLPDAPVSPEEPPMGQVIPFPTHRVRGDRRADEG